MTLRIRLIQYLLCLIERLVFYPRLAAYYKREINKADPIVIDVGANRGQTISFFIKHFSKAGIHAFEPNPKLFQKLIMKFNNTSNIVLYRKGLSNINGELVFNETILNETSTLEELNLKSTYLQVKARVLGVKPERLVSARYMVEVVTLSDFLASQNINQIDVLKIDVEGHEYKCLQGLFSRLNCEIGYIQLEYHNDDMYLDKCKFSDIESILQHNGFFLHMKMKHGFGEFDELIFKKVNLKLND